ncbi:uncharacterized protein LOC119108963 [Pollicipes pollicipes]|uniref:uncharacterized protein LOC119108963 n=1 Tax=Pollicipes pollicipes TaxID=41117 RepID=UPI00188591D0|nr:uncharacterized protein LOC119108963 [Pollicipes pollicipes]
MSLGEREIARAGNSRGPRCASTLEGDIVRGSSRPSRATPAILTRAKRRRPEHSPPPAMEVQLGAQLGEAEWVSPAAAKPARPPAPACSAVRFREQQGDAATGAAARAATARAALD